MSVVLALYPTVMILNLTVGIELGDLDVPEFLGLFIGNVISVGLLTWLLMPLVNRALAFWLAPRDPGSARDALAGALVVIALYGVALLIFGLVT